MGAHLLRDAVGCNARPRYYTELNQSGLARVTLAPPGVSEILCVSGLRFTITG